MNALDRLLSLVRPGDTINLAITGTDNCVQIVIAAQLKDHSYDPMLLDSATNNLVRELTYPHLVRVAPDQSVSTALDAALDSLSGAQNEGLSILSDLDRASARIREAATKVTIERDAKKPAGNYASKEVTVTNEGPAEKGDSDEKETAVPPKNESDPAHDDNPATADETSAASFFGQI